MSWLKRQVRKWLDLPEYVSRTVPLVERNEDLALLTARAVASNAKDPEGRTILEKAVAHVLGLQWGKYNYIPTPASQKILGKALKDLLEEWDRSEVRQEKDLLIAEARSEAMKVVQDWHSKINHESFLDQVVERLKRKQVN